MSVATDWVPKEISLLAKVGQAGEEPCDLARMAKSSAGDVVMNRLTGYVDWLRSTVECVGRWAQEKGSFGIFGTSIAGTWLAGAMEDAIDFFVDEDPSRVGKDHMGKPILHPSQVPAGAKVYFALAPSIAGKVAARVQSKQFETLLPPPLEAQ